MPALFLLLGPKTYSGGRRAFQQQSGEENEKNVKGFCKVLAMMEIPVSATASSLAWLQEHKWEMCSCVCGKTSQTESY